MNAESGTLAKNLQRTVKSAVGIDMLLFAAGILSLFLISLAALYFSFAVTSHPQDAELEQEFVAHEEEFYKLATMFESDSKMTRIASDFTMPGLGATDSIGRERWDEYRSLFTRLGLKDGLFRDPSTRTIRMIVSSSGMISSGSSKGYVYSPKPLVPLAESLDPGDPPINGSGRLNYRRIKGNWYIFLQSN